MTEGRPHDQRRGVTRGYVVGLAAASVIAALALVVGSWGLIGLLTGREPVTTPGVAPITAEVILLLALLVLAIGLWRQAIVLLRGRRVPPWAHILVLAASAYFIWCLGGILAGMSIDETWVSPFALVLALVWALCSLLFWAVLARRVYTDRPPPRWPWERRGSIEGPDWIRPDDPNGSDGPAGGSGS